MEALRSRKKPEQLRAGPVEKMGSARSLRALLLKMVLRPRV